MSDEMAIQETPADYRPKVLLIGAILGAAVGLGAAYLLIQKAEREGENLNIGAGEVVKLGVMVFGLLRSISQLGGKA